MRHSLVVLLHADKRQPGKQFAGLVVRFQLAQHGVVFQCLLVVAKRVHTVCHILNGIHIVRFDSQRIARRVGSPAEVVVQELRRCQMVPVLGRVGVLVDKFVEDLLALAELLFVHRHNAHQLLVAVVVGQSRTRQPLLAVLVGTIVGKHFSHVYTRDVVFVAVFGNVFLYIAVGFAELVLSYHQLCRDECVFDVALVFYLFGNLLCAL